MKKKEDAASAAAPLVPKAAQAPPPSLPPSGRDMPDDDAAFGVPPCEDKSPEDDPTKLMKPFNSSNYRSEYHS